MTYDEKKGESPGRKWPGGAGLIKRSPIVSNGQ